MVRQKQSRPKPQAKRLEISEKDLAKARAIKARHEGAKVSPEWRFIGEFGYFFGFDGVRAIINNEISLDVAYQLIRGARKTYYATVVDAAVAVQTAYAATKSKNPRSVMTKGLRFFMKEAQNG